MLCGSVYALLSKKISKKGLARRPLFLVRVESLVCALYLKAESPGETTLVSVEVARNTRSVTAKHPGHRTIEAIKARLLCVGCAPAPAAVDCPITTSGAAPLIVDGFRRVRRWMSRRVFCRFCQAHSRVPMVFDPFPLLGLL